MSAQDFLPPQPLAPLGQPAALVIAILNTGLTEGFGTVGVLASKKGLRVTLAGRTVARGKTPDELLTAFQASRAKAIAAAK